MNEMDRPLGEAAEQGQTESREQEKRGGMDAIGGALSRLYPGQEGKYYGTVIPARLGGKDPLDGIEVWESGNALPHWHYVTYGFSELYDKECGDPDNSGYGFELTFRLKKTEEEPPVWPMNLLENLARYVFSTGNGFAAGHYIDCSGPVALDEETDLTALAFRVDPELGEIDTPNGHLVFLQAEAVTRDEMEALMCWNGVKFLEQAETILPLGITDLERTSLMKREDFRAAWEKGVQEDGSSTRFLYTDELDAGRQGGESWLRLGKAHADTISTMLRARVGKGRPLYLDSRDATVGFRPGDQAAAELRDGVFTFVLTKEALEELCLVLHNKKGSCRLEQLPLTVELTPGA